MADHELLGRLVVAMAVVAALYSGIVFALFERHPRSQERFNVARWLSRVAITTVLTCIGVVLILFSIVEQKQ